MDDFLLPKFQPSSHDDTFRFFHKRLHHEARGRNLNPEQLNYGASVLGHFAQTSTATDSGMPSLKDLSSIYDKFISDTSVISGPGVLEEAGAQTLILGGYFGDQMRRRYNVEWFCRIGASFFEGAGEDLRKNDPRKSQLLLSISTSYMEMAHTFRDLQRNFLDSHYQSLLLPMFRLDPPS